MRQEKVVRRFACVFALFCLIAATTTSAQSGTKIVLVDSSTQITKTVAGTAGDLSVGTSVTISGSANSDGSITAQNIQIRPAGMGRLGQ